MVIPLVTKWRLTKPGVSQAGYEHRVVI